MTTWRIGDAAALVGVPTHVLRHWEDVGVLEPARRANGHRIYDDETITRARLIRLCQRAGMSLAEIGDLYRGDGQRRAALVRDRRNRIVDQMRRLQAAQEFLDHVLACAHPVVSTCPDCSGFAARSTSEARQS
ncbi:DNA-binding transcriptional MerR regulator [Micromonospora violae]|uniref:DNA-binding transcriptional MerR regulator n=1 Tax=Micromonospora violae TaxID=1278207 RepID=A0A4Q7UHS6_9ACTN|nr:MerR family transcriptional regulator [Micromonospora violae]RZT79043.1 DNA-binding transcriptional MerR regulator [Micromonospora violae]